MATIINAHTQAQPADFEQYLRDKCGFTDEDIDQGFLHLLNKTNGNGSAWPEHLQAEIIKYDKDLSLFNAWFEEELEKRVLEHDSID